MSVCLGEKDIPGLTDTTIPRRLGPKRASKIRKLFNLSKEDDVRQYVVRRPLPQKEGRYIVYDACSIGRLYDYVQRSAMMKNSQLTLKSIAWNNIIGWADN